MADRILMEDGSLLLQEDGTSALLTEDNGISPTGIAPTAAFGTVTVRNRNTIAPTGIAATTAFGVPTLSTGSSLFDGISANVYVSFTTNGTDTPVWTDVTPYVRQVATRRGRQRELERWEPSTATVVLDNRDRRFDPNHTGSPYYPNILPMRRIKVETVYNGVAYPRFYGFTDSFPQAYNHADQTVTLSATDGFKVMANAKLRSAYRNQLLTTGASETGVLHAWWFGDSTVQGDAGNASHYGGGLGNAPEWLRAFIDASTLPSLGAGFYGMWRNDWTRGSSWSAVTGGTTKDVGLWEGSTGVTRGGVWQNTTGGTTTAHTLTWTRPTVEAVSFVDVLYVDGPGYGIGSYSYDGGTTWFDLPTQSGASTYSVQTVRVPVTNPTTFSIRAATQTNTAQAVGIAGIAVYESAATTGFVLHNAGNAGSAIADLNHASSGNPWAVMETTGCDLIILGPFTNETGTGTAFGDSLQTLYDTLHARFPAAKVVIIGQFWQQVRKFYAGGASAGASVTVTGTAVSAPAGTFDLTLDANNTVTAVTGATFVLNGSPRMTINSDTSATLSAAATTNGTGVLQTSFRTTSSMTSCRSQAQSKASANGLTYVDLGTATGMYSTGDLNKSNGILYDCLHPTTTGYYYIAQAVNSALATVDWITTSTTQQLSLWTLDGASESLHGYSATVNGTTSVDSLVPTESDKAMSFNGTTDYVLIRDGLPTHSTHSVEFWFKTTSSNGYVPLVEWGTGTQRNTAVYVSSGALYISSIDLTNGGTGFRLWGRASPVLNDGRAHHIVVTSDVTAGIGCYVDGVAALPDLNIATGSAFTWTSPATVAYLGCMKLAGTTTTPFYSGSLDQVAFYDGALTSTEAAAHYEAGNTAWANDLSGTRLNRILDVVGWPTADRDIDDGDAYLQAFAGDGSSALDAAISVSDSEFGAFYCTPDGKAKFRHRRAAYTDADLNAVQLIFADNGSPFALPYESASLGASDALIRNDVRGSRRNGVEQATEDADSIDKFLRWSFSLPTLELRTDVEVKALCDAVLTEYKNPLQRIDSLTVNLRQSPSASVPYVMPLDLESLIAVVITPLGGGDAITQTGRIESIADNITLNGYTVSFTLSPVEVRNWFQLDSATKGLDQGSLGL